MASAPDWILTLTSPNVRSGTLDVGRKSNLTFDPDDFVVTEDVELNQNVVSARAQSFSSSSLTGQWTDGINRLKTTGSVSIDAGNRYANQLGTDVFFFVSGSVTASSTNANRKVALFGCDVVASGGFFAGSTSKEAMPGKALAYLGNRFGVAPGGDAALYLLGPNNLAGSTNYSLLGSDAGLEINTYGTTLYFEIGTTAYATVTANEQRWGTATFNVDVNQGTGNTYINSSTGLNIGTNQLYSWVFNVPQYPAPNGTTSLTLDAKVTGSINQMRATSGNAADFVIAAQQSQDGQFRGGNLILSSGIGGAPAAGASPLSTSGSIVFKNGGVQGASFASGSLHLDDARTGSYPTTGLIRTPFYPAAVARTLWMGLNSVSASANIVSQNGNSLFFGDNSATNGWSTYLYGYSVAIQGYSGVQINSQIQPTDFYSQATAQSWRFFEYATSNPILTLGSVQGSAPVSASFGALITASLGQTQSTSGNGAPLTVSAQGGFNSGKGGDLILSAGFAGNNAVGNAGGNIVLASMSASLAITTQACSASSTTPFGFFEALYTSGSVTTRVAIPMYSFLKKA